MNPRGSCLTSWVCYRGQGSTFTPSLLDHCTASVSTASNMSAAHMGFIQQDFLIILKANIVPLDNILPCSNGTSRLIRIYAAFEVITHVFCLCSTTKDFELKGWDVMHSLSGKHTQRWFRAASFFELVKHAQAHHWQGKTAHVIQNYLNAVKVMCKTLDIMLLWSLILEWLISLVF